MLSAVICTYNREKYIYNVLRSIAENNFPKDGYEIVLVNNNCTDSTETECLRFRNDFPNVAFHCFHEPNQGLSYARNCGIHVAKGDIIVYIDDDATVNKEYLKTYEDFFAKNEHAVAAGGPIVPHYETSEPDWMSHYTRMLVTGALDLGVKEKEFPHGSFPGGGNVAYRRKVFDQVGLFNVELGRKGNSLIGAEEKDLFDKMTSKGMKFYYLPTAILYHIIPERKLTEDYFNRVSYGVGQSERYRTKSISESKYHKRIFKEAVNWCGTLVLWLGFALKGQFKKGNKLVAFRKRATRGLLGKKMGGDLT